jgi:hypothetical protein
MTRSEIKDLIKQAYTNASAKATSPVPTPQEEKPSANVLKFPIVARFPEIDKILVQLMTDQYGVFIKDIEWVAPKPTTFRIKLANNQYFYLTYGEKSWTAQVEGKKYYLLNIQEEERAMESLARILKYGGEKTEEDKTVSKEPNADLGGGEAPILTPSPETLSREPEGVEVSPEEFETPPAEAAPEEETPAPEEEA